MRQVGPAGAGTPPRSWTAIWVRGAVLALVLALVTCAVAQDSHFQGPPLKRAAEELSGAENMRERLNQPLKPDFELSHPVTLPADARGTQSFLKGGHWTSIRQAVQANQADFLGQLDTELVDPEQGPIALDGTEFYLQAVRKATLPKSQAKQLESTLFLPQAQGRAQLMTVLRSPGAGVQLRHPGPLHVEVPAHQYFFLILAANAHRYAPLEHLDAIRISHAQTELATPLAHYQVVAPAMRAPVAVPSHPLAWTAIAYVLWDDFSPEKLTFEQQQSLVDWLHWGGQLVISGPGSLEKLHSSFLQELLPAQFVQAERYPQQAFDEINATWSRHGSKEQPLTIRRPWAGIRLKKHPAARWVPNTGRLLAERSIGRGRVVVSAFRLSESALQRWKDFGSFVNSGLLGRPPRRFQWNGNEGLQVSWADGETSYVDARRVTGLRYFSRDTGGNRHLRRATAEEQELAQFIPAKETEASEFIESTASWSPFGQVSTVARDTLRKAAGISVPTPAFVLTILGLYLIAIVPVNWLIFRTLGRVELAWAAAPVWAILFSVVVVVGARLDLGFGQQLTEVAILETQGSYLRGHLTRYMAIYTSLSTPYDLHFTDRSAVAQPFPAERVEELGSGTREVSFRCHDQISLSGVTIASNTTGLIHSEQMLDLKGPIELERLSGGRLRVRNSSQFDLTSVEIVRRRVEAGQPVLDGSWLGELPAGSFKDVQVAALDRANSLLRAKRRQQTAGDSPAVLDLEPLFELAEDAQMLQDEEIRLIGRIEGIVPGVRVSPEVTQPRGGTFLVAHLEYGSALAPVPQADVNRQRDVEPPVRD